MRTLGIIVLCVVLLIGGGVAWYKLTFPTYTYRYRMTVEVEEGDKVHTGSSVIEVTVNRQPQFGSAPPTVSRFRGDAVFVDLGGARNVIALLAGGSRAEDVNYSYSLVPGLFGLTFDDRDLAKLAGLRGTREVPKGRLPTFLSFVDINDSGSAQIVAAEEFARTFGPGVRLKSVAISMTEDDVTRQIETKIPRIIGKLREEAKALQVTKAGSPYKARLGHFIGG